MNTLDEIHSQGLLVVEGNDEVGFFLSLKKFLGLSEPDIFNINGRTNFKSCVRQLTLISGFSGVRKVGFVLDAEQNPAPATFQSITSTIRTTLPFLPAPERPGEVISGGVFRCGVFVMPDNAGAGALEDLCLESVRDSAVMPLVDRYVAGAEELLAPKERDAYNVRKARMQTFLAGRPRVVASLSVAARQGTWDFSAAAFSKVRQFMIDLYG